MRAANRNEGTRLLVDMFERASDDQRQRYVAKRLAGPMPDDVFAAICESLRRSAERDTDPDTLSAREVEVVRLLAEGLSRKQVAYRLGIATPTVRAHTVRIHRKLGVHNRVEMILRASDRGLLADLRST